MSSELLTNCEEHSDADCLVKIISCPIEDRFTKKVDEMIYINFISFSNTKIETKLLEIINRGELDKYSGGKIVAKALDNHKSLFNNEYNISDFAMVSTFQKNVSTRENSYYSGGKGLTVFVSRIHNKTSEKQETQSYVLNGDKCLYFYTKYLSIKDDGTIGFNELNDYYNYMPDKNCFMKQENNFPGIIYNIGIVYNKEGEESE